MKKIGVLTTSYAGSGCYGCNYGAALQGYALIKQLRLLGYEAWDINYLSDTVYEPRQYNFFKRCLKRLPLLFNTSLLLKKIRNIKTRKVRRLNRDKFFEFVSKFDLTYQNGKFFQFEDLRTISQEFYAFIVGSDVVWNPYLHKNINEKGFFLDFATNLSKRIAYAPSFGVTSLPETARGNLKELLLKLNAISVRERSGADLIYEETGIRVPVVLDPTLLLSPEHYKDAISIPLNLPQKYIVVYRFGKLKYFLENILNISKKMKLPIVYIPSNNDGHFVPHYEFGPSEFLGVIKNAELVLSDSFHCTALSIVFHRPFLTFLRTLPQEGKDINSRMIDLLEMLQLKERMVFPEDKIDFDKLFDIDFSTTEKCLRTLRQDSLLYLNEALK